jgi:DNA-directed RNA polymerase subunit RPC12/RpoP
MINFRCSHCQQKIGAPDTYAGKRVRCAKCRQPIRVPDAQQAAEQQKSAIIKFRCPNCNQKIGIAQKYAGKRIRCAKCKNPLRVPELPAKTPQQPTTAETSGGDQMFSDVMWGDDALAAAATAEAGAPPAEEALRLKPPTPLPQTVAQTTCPACGAPNRADTQFCITCGETIVVSQPEAAPGISAAAKVPLSLGAAFAFTIGGAIAWTLIAALVGLRWVTFMAVPVAGLAGVGLVVFTEKRNAALGLLAALIGLFGIICGKVFIAEWVVLPAMEKAMAETEMEDFSLTDEQVEERAKSPYFLFRAACFQLVEEGEFDKDFAKKVVATHIDGRAPLGEAEQVKAGMDKVEARLNSWSESEKRDAIRAQHARDVEAMRDLGKALVGALAEATEEDANVGQTWRETAREANELVTGERTLAETRIGFIFALIGSFCLLDLLFFPMGLWSAYKIGTGRD